MLRLLLVISMSLFVGNSPPVDHCSSIEARCYGKDPCRACSDCSMCNYCSNGGTCGVCASPKRKVKNKVNLYQVNATLLLKRVPAAGGLHSQMDTAFNMVGN